jgi:hypothetical protein
MNPIRDDDSRRIAVESHGSRNDDRFIGRPVVLGDIRRVDRVAFGVREKPLRNADRDFALILLAWLKRDGLSMEAIMHMLKRTRDVCLDDECGIVSVHLANRGRHPLSKEKRDGVVGVIAKCDCCVRARSPILRYAMSCDCREHHGIIRGDNLSDSRLTTDCHSELRDHHDSQVSYEHSYHLTLRPNACNHVALARSSRRATKRE